MDVFEALEGLKSIRSYKSDYVPSAVLRKVLDAARWASSAGNCQPWAFIIVKDSEVKKCLRDA